MALGNNSSALYVDIRNGKIFRYSKTEEKGTTPVLNTKGEKKFYYIYDYIEGHVTNFSTREEEIQNTKKMIFQIHMQDGSDNYVVKMGLDTTYFRMFCSVIPNIDWTKKVRLIPRIKEENGVKKSSLIVVNNGTPMKFAFTRENLNGKPDITITKNKKGEVIDVDREEETQFFLDLVGKTLPKLVHPALAGSYEKPEAVKETHVEYDNIDTPDSDLPF